MTPTYSTQHTSFVTNDGLELPALLFTPVAPTRKVLLFLHGNGSSSVFYKPHKMKVFAQTLTMAGWAFLPFNNRGAHYLKKFRLLPEKTQEVLQGTWTERIEESALDLEAAVLFAKAQGFTEIVVAGESSGANKILVYNHIHPQNEVKGFALVGGGDDTGLWCRNLADQYQPMLQKSRSMVAQGRGQELISTVLSHGLLSYQSLLDTIDPDGFYNGFPFLEASGQARLSSKPLFHLFSELKKPVLALYGALDKYCVVSASEAVKLLESKSSSPQIFTGVVVEGADHSFEDQEQAEVDAILSWILSQNW